MGYTVWICPFCTLQNDINWQKCDGCQCTKPPSDQTQISYSYMKPKKMNGVAFDNNNNNKNYNINNNNNNNYNQWPQDNKDKHKNRKKNIVRKPRISNIGVPRSIHLYPSKSVLKD